MLPARPLWGGWYRAFPASRTLCFPANLLSKLRSIAVTSRFVHAKDTQLFAISLRRYRLVLLEVVYKAGLQRALDEGLLGLHQSRAYVIQREGRRTVRLTKAQSVNRWSNADMA
jgi:hypothetical protein